MIVFRGLQLDRGSTCGGVTSRLASAINIADETLDYVGAFLDATTNYYAHTGTQTVARALIHDVVSEA